MKRIGLFLLVIIVYITPVFADYGWNLEQFMNTYVQIVAKDKNIPSTYRYIQLKYKNVNEGTKIYDTLQKAVYLDLLPNANINLPLDKKITEDRVYNTVSKNFKLNIPVDKKSLVRIDRLKEIFLQVIGKDKQPKIVGKEKIDITNDPLFLDVYQKLQDYYISDTGLDKKLLLDGTIKGLVGSLNDPYTSFFPATEAKSFTEELNGEYYGIGSHVEMNTPGVLMIVSPMKGSPSEKAGLLGGDRIVKINDKIIDDKVSLNESISLIKGPAGTSVKVKVLRDGKLLDFTITREKITIDDLESKVYAQDKSSVCLVSISMFDFAVSNGFKNIMTDLSTKKCSKYIFDVRNNPGGSLSEVINILDYFVPSGETSVTIKSKFLVEDVVASNQSKISSIPVRVLINKGSASASEIFAGVIKDYVKNALLVGEKTFGKGSVQEVFNYDDGSMLKYTIAKRYMGKSKVNIDKVGISPDVAISDKLDTVEDEVLDWAIAN